ncbi:MAG TPA: hypothetical protein VLW53_04615 [Candidatus Eisenbacteria bacterium]|nr:hypothetical protein [Candidatus Eisenbacteria bacterium]
MARELTADAVVRELRRRRVSRRQRPHGFELVAWVEAAALFVAYATFGLWLLVGGPPITGQQLELVRAHGAAATGVGFALVVGLSLRSGLHGGPLSIERADVQHLLLAPVSRRAVLQPLAVRRLVLAAGAGAVAGGVAGLLTAARLPGGHAAWIGAGAVAGALAGTLTAAPAMIVSGRRLPAHWVGGVWLLLLALAAADLAAGTSLSPASWFGLVALWPIVPSPLAAPALPASALVVAAGLGAVAGTPVEVLDRRSGLVAELQFAAGSRDVRSLTRAGHQLAEEAPRGRPWLRLPGWFGGAVWRRHWQSLLRWSLGRVARVAVMAVGAAAGLALAWVGASYFLVLAGLLTYAVGLEVLEPWSEEADRPDLTASLPRGRGALLLGHLPAAILAAALVGLVALAAVAALRPAPGVLAVGAILLLPSAIAAVCGAAVRGRPGVVWEAVPQDQLGGGAFLVLFHVAAPPSLAILGLVPVLMARNAALAGHDPLPAALASGLVVALAAPLAPLALRATSLFTVEG